ncbi:hypothetical protein EDB19DRAFT_1832442 [Suillus lakei]|nr:hypothetical protein EDB19DRAFT_1832442 [Suillus lakei]
MPEEVRVMAKQGRATGDGVTLAPSREGRHSTKEEKNSRWEKKGLPRGKNGGWEKEGGVTDSHLWQAIRTTQIGVGKLNILKIANKLKFGTYNEQPQKSTEVNKMITSFEMNGHQWFKEENALAIIIKSNQICNIEDLQGEWDDADDLNEVEFVDEDVLLMVSGQHQVAAPRKMGEGYVAEKTVLEKRSIRLAESANPSEDNIEEHDTIRARLAVVLGELETLGTWSVKLYNQVAQLDFSLVGRTYNN